MTKETARHLLCPPPTPGPPAHTPRSVRLTRRCLWRERPKADGWRVVLPPSIPRKKAVSQFHSHPSLFPTPPFPSLDPFHSPPRLRHDGRRYVPPRVPEKRRDKTHINGAAQTPIPLRAKPCRAPLPASSPVACRLHLFPLSSPIPFRRVLCQFPFGGGAKKERKLLASFSCFFVVKCFFRFSRFLHFVRSVFAVFWYTCFLCFCVLTQRNKGVSVFWLRKEKGVFCDAENICDVLCLTRRKARV